MRKYFRRKISVDGEGRLTVLVKIRVDYELQPLEVGTAKAGLNLKSLSEKPRENGPG